MWEKSLVNQQTAATFLAAGAKPEDVKVPSFEEQQERFDEALVAEPKPQSQSPADVLFRELGLAA